MGQKNSALGITRKNETRDPAELETIYKPDNARGILVEKTQGN